MVLRTVSSPFLYIHQIVIPHTQTFAATRSNPYTVHFIFCLSLNLGRSHEDRLKPRPAPKVPRTS